MIENGRYFFVGVGGSGMLPLAQILRGRGLSVEGSDRSLDQARTSEKFDYLRAQGVVLHAQDGSGVISAEQIVVASGAVEDSVPDMVAAKRVGARVLRRPELLAQLFNAAPLSIGVAGTSGKSTVTAMIGWMLHQAGLGPTIMNGAVMKNFVRPDALFASALVGAGEAFVSEVDESDGSIALYQPRVAVLNNIALDHKSMEELRALFAGFVSKAETGVINLDNGESAALAGRARNAISYSIEGKPARLMARNLAQAADGIAFDVSDTSTGDSASVRLKVPGAHNVSNALAAIGAALACGLSLAQAAEALSSFAGISRRLEVVGSAGGVTVIDDFAHNPDKITATLATLHAFPGRLLILFQPHGFGPLKLMKHELIETFATQMQAEDVLVMPEPVYYGGTTERSVSSGDIIAGVAARGREAEAHLERAQCGERLIALAKPGDRILVMGARDDTLTSFAQGLLARLG
jgi:UDP-N-acetylmuramate--alanine ligase